jgi:hypothetical protein
MVGRKPNFRQRAYEIGVGDIRHVFSFSPLIVMLGILVPGAV